ncbi:lycopene beta-cyclase CrtY [Pacificimonas sp. WHA3]|uniref:Lycopene beta-cyclase CrtY n=1 Tax=Pacificimonas pallii TaxID=2827236 RepID=A0ABS6SHK6_9SPHN|nr:lycopene beta-cyclase CrtY [Pacificimonas pallii]MBV7257894.1 lycopene beta-cyclase CrtY [Pacificimonas pallii]
MRDFDLILAGGGLAAGLIAMRMADVRPGVSVGIVEAGDTIGGDHIWSSFDTDVRGPQRMWTQELYAHRWDDGYDVRFPRFERTLRTPYASARSDLLDKAVRARLDQGALMLGKRVEALTPTMVRLEDGQVLKAGAVIDCRGQGRAKHLKLAWQKFVGLEIECDVPHGRTRPTVMDATVDQLGGYRFVYVLPFSETRLLVEDTYYTDGPELADDVVLQRVRDYVARMAVGPYREERAERGVLPIALDGDIDAHWAEDDMPKAGMAAALFNPITGYSFSDAVATADMLKSTPRLDAGPVFQALRDHSIARWKERAFYRLLNRMMFEAATPETRYRTLQHFYALDEGLVERFYASRSTKADMVRILSGEPPVPVGKALGVLARSIPKIRLRPRWRSRDEE